ncbi:stressosome-associated protein Prli42 [Salirhabdus sp. Marseille-P4669]|uniref:stressosome-associated protein Prli42 n=1 Tax=Salirhabdus sp. Marseille-P4669 TaxID=2042310 RepID=UPI000C7C0114|nr:stressosome-associated protein Prli42 [Salirhabdus sp. Marseille-P4669]
MANQKKKKNNISAQQKPRKSKRQKRIQIVVWLMILSMLASVFLAGASMFL